jgi:coenzyme F420-dependent glucose-6-phosphate dehydrogenase
MTRYGYHAAHEQFTPSDLLRYVAAAEEAGFELANSSDHFHPWSQNQGQSGHAWTWMGAALHATSLPMATVSAPGYRYHPAILAQSIATAAQMFEGRVSVALGSGEAINEGITGLPWPDKPERTARLRECAEIIRALLAGETATHRGRVTVVEAKLYTRPTKPVPLFAAAVTPATAAEVAQWADGLLTVSGEPEKVRKTLDAFRSNGGAGKPVQIQHAVSWAPTREEAEREALDQWFTGAIGGDAAWQLRTPAQFDTLSKIVSLDDLRDVLDISEDLNFHADRIAALAELDVDAILLHNVARNQSAFIEAFGEKVLPALPR